MIEIYTSAFNLIKNKFNYQFHLKNFCNFADKVTIAINDSEDDTLNKVFEWREENETRNLKVIKVSFPYDSPTMDGDIKNAALQECTEPYCIGLDMDEAINPSIKHRWIDWVNELSKQSIDALLIPTIDLYGDITRTRWDDEKSILGKWYLHKNNKELKRGVVNFAKYNNGHHDIKRSDSCELIYKKDDSLVKYVPLVNHNFPTPQKYYDYINDNNVPYVFHLGYLSLVRRALMNENFWKKHWSTEEGSEIEVPTFVGQLYKVTYPHGLDIEFLKDY
jgi:hypothetical protein